MESTSTNLVASALHQQILTQPQRVLDHLTFVSKWQDDYATRAAVYYSRINPYQLATMPDDLTREMLKRKENEIIRR